MSHTRAWDEINPQDSDVAGYGAQEMRWDRQNVRERLAIDHNWAETSGTDDTSLEFDGLHKKCTLVNTTTILAGEANKVIISAADENGVAEPCYTREDNLASLLMPPTGSLFPFAGATAPTGYLMCDGSEVSRTTYATLYAVTGDAYGAGDGATTFNLPNLIDRIPIGAGSSYAIGSTGGEATHTLSEAELAPHRHWDGGVSVGPAIGYGAPAGPFGLFGLSQSTGGGAAHNNVQPYQAFSYIIKY